MTDRTHGRFARLPALASTFLFWWVAGLALVAPGVLGNVTPYTIGVTWIILFIITLVRGRLIAAYESLVARMFLISWLSLVALFSITAREPMDVIHALNFSPFVFLGPVAMVLDSRAAPNRGLIIAVLCCLGAAIICAVAAGNAFLLGNERGSSRLFAVIVMTNTAVLLGFIGIGGVWLTTSRWRWLLLSGPVFGVVTALITVSRGPLVGVTPLAILASIFLVTQLKLRLPVVLAAAAALVAALVAAILISPGRMGALTAIVSELAGGRAVTDYTTSVRLALLEAGYRAFWDAPIFGHGWERLMSSVRPYLPPEHVEYAGQLPQLHNDVMDFAVSAGVVGIALYFFILATPVVAALRSPRDSQWTFRLYATLALSIGYAFAGLTDIMIGFEFHTQMFAAVSVLILAACRDRPVKALSPA